MNVNYRKMQEKIVASLYELAFVAILLEYSIEHHEMLSFHTPHSSYNPILFFFEITIENFSHLSG